MEVAILVLVALNTAVTCFLVFWTMLLDGNEPAERAERNPDCCWPECGCCRKDNRGPFVDMS